MVRLLLIFFATIIMSLNLWAQISSVKTKSPESTKNFSENVSLYIGQEFSSNFNKDPDGQTESYSSTSMAFSYKLKNQHMLSVSSSFGKALNSEQKGSLANTKIKWADNKRKIFNGRASFKNGIYLLAPTSEIDREQTSFRSAFAYEPTISWDLKDYFLPLSFSLVPGLRRNFHKYTTTASGDSNVEYIGSLSLSANYEISDRYHLAILASYANTRTIQGIHKQSYGLTEQIAISLPRNFNISIGHRTGGNVERADGSSNINIYDDLDSEFFTNISYTM